MALTREQLLARHQELCDKARAIIESKNKDYGADEDIFRNFRRHGRFGICVRLSDKLSRLETFAERGTLENESMLDSVIDLINYAILYETFE